MSATPRPWQDLLEAAIHVAESGLAFSDPRLSYEEWQVDKGAMGALRCRHRKGRARGERA